jgi:hypothetical protein
MKLKSVSSAILASIGLFCTPSLRATVFVSVIPYSSNWQNTYNAFGVQESFENLTLAPGLSITLDGNAFPAPQTYSSLPQLYDPAQPSPVDGPQLNNTWAGTRMVTNFGYDSARPSAANWLNAWAPAISSAAQRITFNFSGGVTQLGIGLSNFQSVNPPSPDASWTNHRLYINGIPLSQDIETLAASDWTPGANVRNGYLVVSTTGGTVVNSIGFQNIDTPGGVSDGLNFDTLGFTPVPEPPTTSLLLSAGGLLALCARLRFLAR